MKRIILISFMLISVCALKAQQLSYAYDAAGNRVSRTIVLDTRSTSALVNETTLSSLKRYWLRNRLRSIPTRRIVLTTLSRIIPLQWRASSPCLIWWYDAEQRPYNGRNNLCGDESVSQRDLCALYSTQRAAHKLEGDKKITKKINHMKNCLSCHYMLLIEYKNGLCTTRYHNYSKKIHSRLANWTEEQIVQWEDSVKKALYPKPLLNL
jgi:hypothetical protein